MREMGGLLRRMPWTSATFTIGSLALAGIFPFSGFWSKDEILTVLLHEHHYVVFTIALAGAFLTAFYVTRLWFRVFAGPPQTEGLHEANASMIAPMVVLAAITTVIGVWSPGFSAFLGHEGEWPNIAIALTGTAVGLSGFALGYWVYGRRSVVLNTRSLKRRMGYSYDALTQKLYFDLTYDTFIIRPYMVVCGWLAAFDARVIDGAVNGVARAWVALSSGAWVFDARAVDGAVNGAAHAVREVGSRLRRVESGRIQTYQRLILGAVVLLMLYVVVKGA
jgi:NADH-quinone oxidoreductase subunit L